MVYKIILVCCLIGWVSINCNPVPDQKAKLSTIENAAFEHPADHVQNKNKLFIGANDDLMAQETFHYWAHGPLWGSWRSYYRPYYHGWHNPYWGGYWHMWW